MILRARGRLSLLAVVLAVGGAACEHEHAHDHNDHPNSGATCPTPQTLTYDNFGRDFMDRFCRRCHGSNQTGAARQGAPLDHTFDSLDEIRPLRDHIDKHAAAGPNATNTDMPPNDPRPTLEQRKQLGEWLACGAP
jgi:hypothetical protein